MCGICGIYGEGDQQPAVKAMIGAMYHRGPDDSGLFSDDRVVLGMTRLAVIDTSIGGHQPMQNRAGTIAIVYNGELYNFRSERKLLEDKGYVFASSSDTEVVLQMYEHYGDDFLQRLRGMFALAVYDRRGGKGRERLLLARDQFGIKPLLYTHVDGKLIFASELKAMLASGLMSSELDPVAIRLYLTGGVVYQPHTILRRVKMLLPAHRMILEGGCERIEPYWQLKTNRRPELRQYSYEKNVEEVANALKESLRLQLVSDVPIGAFLSGGIDSSLLVALMARSIGGSRVKTFSVGFDAQDEAYDESDEAEQTSRFIGTDHTRIKVRGDDVRDHIERIAYGLDQPSWDGVNSYFVSLAARRSVTVAISGTGGDELFAGYPWFGAMVIDQLRREAEPWHEMARTMIASVLRSRWFNPLIGLRGGWRIAAARDHTDFVTQYAGIFRFFSTTEVERLLAGTQWILELERDESYMESAICRQDELPQGSAIERVTGLCLRGYTGSQLLRDIDAVSMIHSLEVRVPFLDPVMTDIALSLPDEAKMKIPPDLTNWMISSYRELGAKRILLDIGEKILPPGYSSRPKRGFTLPFGTWLRGPLRDVLIETLSLEQVRRRGWLNAEAVVEVRDRFLDGQITWIKPWILMMFELWARTVLDRATCTDRLQNEAGAVL